jgi:hypothetical protein
MMARCIVCLDFPSGDNLRYPSHGWSLWSATQIHVSVVQYVMMIDLF